MNRPYIDENGDLVIPFSSSDRYFYWQKGRMTLKEIEEEAKKDQMVLVPVNEEREMLVKITDNLDVYRGRGAKILTKAEQIVIESKETYEDAVVGINMIRDILDGIEATRKEVTQELQKEKAKRDVLFQIIREPFATANRILSEKMSTWAELKKREKEEKERLIKETEQKKKPTQEEVKDMRQAQLDLLSETTTTKVDIGGKQLKATTKTQWNFELLDFSAVLDEWKQLNETLINTVIRKKGGVRKIEGLRIYPKEIVSR